MENTKSLGWFSDGKLFCETLVDKTATNKEKGKEKQSAKKNNTATTATTAKKEQSNYTPLVASTRSATNTKSNSSLFGADMVKGKVGSKPSSMDKGVSQYQITEITQTVKTINNKIDGIETSLNELEGLFSERIMHTSHEEKIVEDMHEQLQKFREGLYAQLLKPVLVDIIEVRDSIMRISQFYLKKAQGEQDVPNKTFCEYAFDLQEILEKNGVEVFKSEVGDDFKPTMQKAVKKLPTTDKKLHGKVAQSLSSGYSYNNVTITPEKIVVYFYKST